MKIFRLNYLLIVLLTGLFSLFHTHGFSQQNVGIGTTTPAGSAMLDITATDKGVLIPRLTTAQRIAIAAPATGLMVYDTDYAQFWYYDGVQWTAIGIGTGPTGPTGPQGPTGDQGLTGPTGDQGAQGIQGIQGVAGPQGPTGDQGLAGAAGPQGVQGIQGLQGVTGPTGDQGLTGPVGPQGAQGIQGIQGVAGPQGPTGDQGLAGAAGPQGAQGIQGLQGVTGPTGDQGLTGPVGPQGVQGIQGIQGVAGPQGTTGPVGCSSPNYVIKSDGTTALCSIIYDNGTNVGIGTSSPSSKLEIGGTANLTLRNATTYSTLGDDLSMINFGDAYSGSQARILAERGAAGSGGDNPTDLSFWTTPDSTVALTERMRVCNNGYVGIGISTPTSKLHVLGNGKNIPVIFGRNTNSDAGVASYGVRGEVNSSGLGSAGVFGYSNNSGQNEIGTLGDYSLWGAAIFGMAWGGVLADMPASKDFGVFATVSFSTGTGVYANNGSSGGNAIYGSGNQVITGTKSASVPTTKGNQLLYCMESPEVLFEDFGSGQLVNGKAVITLDPLFLETVFIDESHPYKVFIQMEGECQGVYVSNKSNNSFEVKELNKGTSNANFSYRIIAKRKYYQDHRFGCDWMQPFEDNTNKKEYVKPYPVDPKVTKQWVDEQKNLKEALQKQLLNEKN